MDVLGNAITDAAETAAADEANVAQEPKETTTDVENPSDDEQEEKPARTFTQDELAAKLAKQRARSERQYARKLEAVQAEMAELKDAQKAAGEKATAGAETAKAPVRTDFDSYEDYIGAKARFDAGEEVRKEIAQLKKEREEEKVSQKTKSSEEAYMKQAQARVTAGRKEFPDFDVVVAEVIEDEVVVPGSELYLGIIDSPLGHRIIMHLAKNPELAEKINEMTPRGVHRELGKLEDKLKGEPAKKKPDSLMEPLNGHGKTPKPNDPTREDISMEEYARLMNAREDKRRKGI